MRRGTAKGRIVVVALEQYLAFFNFTRTHTDILTNDCPSSQNDPVRKSKTQIQIYLFIYF